MAKVAAASKMDWVRNKWQGIDPAQRHEKSLEGDLAASHLQLSSITREITEKEKELDEIANSGSEGEFFVADIQLSSLGSELASQMQHSAVLADQRNAMTAMQRQKEQAILAKETARHLSDYRNSGVANQLVGSTRSAYHGMDYVQGASNRVYDVRNESKTNRRMIQMQMAQRRARERMKVSRTQVPTTNHEAVANSRVPAHAQPQQYTRN